MLKGQGAEFLPIVVPSNLKTICTSSIIEFLERLS